MSKQRLTTLPGTTYDQIVEIQEVLYSYNLVGPYDRKMNGYSYNLVGPYDRKMNGYT